MKKTKKILSWLIGSIGLIYVLIIIFPQFLFENKFEYKNFSVYYHADEVDSENLKSVLYESEELIMHSDLYGTETNQNIFICSSYNEFTFFAFLSWKAFAINYPITQHIFLSKSSVSENSIVRNGAENNKRKLSSVIAHETTHSLLENKLGIINYKLLPTWKNEGYCDFIANESSYNEQKGLQEICTNKETSENLSFKYFKYRMLTQYLFKERKISIDEFLKEDFDLKEIIESFRKKHCVQ